MRKTKKIQINSSKSRPHQIEPLKLDGTEQKGIIIAHFGAKVEVEDEQGMIYTCHLRRNAEAAITGDHVLWSPTSQQEGVYEGVVVKILPRYSLLAKPDKGQKNKLIAANIDYLIIVAAPFSLFSEYLIDRYIVAAENLKLRPVILLNKIDLLSASELAELKIRLSTYEKLGYTILYSSVLKNELNSLENLLQGKTGVLVGLSGVGKSSIIAAMTGLTHIVIGEVSAKAGLGKHTTTTTRLYHLPHEGQLIDSPGVREFALWHLNKTEVLNGFIEFQPFLGNCKFRNCGHHSEPGCALLKAVEENKISASRWESYQTILSEVK